MSETCRHCGQAITQLPAGMWADDGGFVACIKGAVWRDPITEVVERRPAVDHLPMPAIGIAS